MYYEERYNQLTEILNKEFEISHHKCLAADRLMDRYLKKVSGWRIFLYPFYYSRICKVMGIWDDELKNLGFIVSLFTKLAEK